MFWEAITVSHCGKESSCAHVSNFDSLPRESPDVTPLIFVCWVGGMATFTEGRWTYETNFSLAFWILLPARRKVKIVSDEQHAIFAHKFQSALRKAVGVSNVYCEL